MTTADHQPADPKRAWDLLMRGQPLRAGRSVGRTLYVQTGSDPSKRDLLIGIVDSPELAEWIVRTVNEAGDA